MKGEAGARHGGEAGGEAGAQHGGEADGEASGEAGGEAGGKPSMWYCPELFDLPGGYRPLVAFASDVSSELIAYTDVTLPLEPMDVDALESRPQASLVGGWRPPAARGSAQTGGLPSQAAEPAPPRTRWAWKLSFSLPSSVYATMLLREILHEPLDLEEHASRSKRLLKGEAPY